MMELIKNGWWSDHLFLLLSKGDEIMEIQKYAVGNWMGDVSHRLNQTSSLHEALQMFGKTDSTSLPIVERKHFIGLLRFKDCMEQLSHGVSWTIPIKQMIISAYKAVESDFPMTELVEIPTYIINEDSELIGVIGGTELFNFNQAIAEDLQEKEELVKWFELCFDTAYEGLTVVDADGIIRLFNESYSRFVGVSKEEAIGQKADQVIDNTRLPVVLKTGIPERSQAHRLRGQNLVVHRLPIWKENQVIGAVGILVYEGVSEIYQVIERMELLDGDHNRRKNLIPIAPSVQEKKVRFEDILGESLVISETKNMARKAADSMATVLITGESGVGKEQFARVIHDTGITNQGEFISVNCAAIPDSLLESELFGYEKGAFTGASTEGKVGKFELAHNGTLFLDEIGDMPMAMQVKILRVIQEKKIERVGGTTSIPINFRLITATNKNLKKMVDKEEFREDLYYRLFVIPVHIPPLRDRKQDIPIIIANKIYHLAEAYGVSEKTIDQPIIQLMHTYDWPGNIRELMNVLERLFVLTEGDHISIKNIPQSLFPERQPPVIETQHKRSEALKEAMAEEEKDDIERTLKQAKGNKSQAAKLLGISRATLYNKLSRFSIER